MNPRIKINYPWLIFWFFVNIYVDSVPLWDFLFSIVYFKNFLNFLHNRFGLGYNNLFDAQIFKIFTFLSKGYLLTIIYKIIAGTQVSLTNPNKIPVSYKEPKLHRFINLIKYNCNIFTNIILLNF